MSAIRSRGTYQRPQRGRCAPGFTGAGLVAHAVAVGAQASEVVELGGPRPRSMKGSDVVHLDVTLAKRPVGASEIEGADLAAQRPAALSSLFDLQSAKLRIPLACEGPTDQQSAFDGGEAGLVDFVRLGRNELQLPRADTFLDCVGGCEHLLLAIHEGSDHQPRGLTAPGPLAAIAGVVGGEVSGLSADTVRRPEAREGLGLCGMQGQRTEQLRQFLNLRVSRPQLVPAVPHHERAGKYELIFSPRRSPHAQYRMSVRSDGGCVQRTVSRAAHLGRSRCQWGLSPSVMVVRAECPPLRIGKEGHDPHE